MISIICSFLMIVNSEGEELCVDKANLSNVCLYSLSKCTCSELLENTDCCSEYQPTESFSPNDGECDMERVRSNIRENSDGWEDWVVETCDEWISYYNKYGNSWTTSQTECFSAIPGNIASWIFNCKLDGVLLLEQWENPWVPRSRSLNLTFNVTTIKLCPKTCGQCGDSGTCTPTAGPSTQPISTSTPTAQPSTTLAPSEAERSTPGSSTQANNWWVYLLIVVGVIILLAVIMYRRGGICMNSKEGVASEGVTELSTAKDFAEGGQIMGEKQTQI